MKLTNLEKETVIVFNEADPTAEVFTYNGRMLRELAKLAGDRPDDVEHVSDNGNGASTYRVPKKWVKIRAKRILSEEERVQRANTMRRIKSEPKNADN